MSKTKPKVPATLHVGGEHDLPAVTTPAEVTAPTSYGNSEGTCSICGQAACGGEHILVEFAQDVILNSVKYPAGATCHYPANADFFSAVMRKKG